ncbi:MAG TPA: hypothetical protein DHW39_05610 [Erysipelotrichaceae bacterium]|nr:hypothetical protein [Erysipelotrichaceae bacterium]
MRRNLRKWNRHSLMMGTICALTLFTGMKAANVLAAGENTEDETYVEDSGLIEISQQEADPLAVLKRSVIEMKANMDDTVVLEDISIDNSKIETFGFDRNRNGLQNVKVKVSLTNNDDTTSLGYSFEETVPVKMVKSTAPVIRLKNDSVVVNNGDVWNAASYLAYINDDSGILPVLKVEGDINMNVDGDYTVTYTALDTEGNSSEAVLHIAVRTHEEVIRAREEAERKAREEEAKRKAEEARRRLQLNASVSFTAPSGFEMRGTGSNPYRGGWSNCTWGAWQLVYNNQGVKLPQFHNAYEWLKYAQAYGYSTGSTPRVGSVAVYKRHVAYVAAISDDGTQVYIKEGGHNGKYNERWVSATEGIPTQFLRGYIYIGN